MQKTPATSASDFDNLDIANIWLKLNELLICCQNPVQMLKDFLCTRINQPDWSVNPAVEYTIPSLDAFWFYQSTSFLNIVQTQDNSLLIFDRPASMFTLQKAGTYKISFYIAVNNSFSAVSVGKVELVDETNTVIYGGVLSQMAVGVKNIFYQNIITVNAGQKFYVKNSGIPLTYGTINPFLDAHSVGSISIEQIN